MANRTILLCLVLSISLTWYIDNVAGSPKRGGWSSRPSSSSSWSKPSYKPSSSSSSWSSWGSKPSYPSSGSGLSGYGSGSSKPSYPSSGSGLSGYGSGSSKPSYPSSGSGLSGYGSGYSKPSYPSSGSGLSGYGSGSGGSSWNWWSGSSSSNTGSGSHSYPSGGLSGSGSRPSYTVSPLPAGVEYVNNNYGHHSGRSPSHTNNKYGNNYATPHNTHVVNNHITHVYSTPYYTSPQYVYVNEYRNSGSRYGDILTGLALYNMGRSHSSYHDHYYHDDYHVRRYNSDGNMNNNYSPQNAAVCTMKISENGRVEVLKIPCAIVSTFTNVGKQVTFPESQTNSTVCVTNSTVFNSTAPVNPISTVLNGTAPVNVTSTVLNGTAPVNATSTVLNGTAPVNATSANSNLSSNVTTVNSTTCTITVNATDPLKAKGPPVNASNMVCEVEITTREMRTSNRVDCNTLLNYSKMAEPKTDNIILPDKQKLKKLITNPPWWMSLFIAV